MRNATHLAAAVLLLTLPVLASAQTPHCDPASDPFCKLADPIADAGSNVGATSVNITPHPSWTNMLAHDNGEFFKQELVFDPFLGPTGTRWVKLTVLTEDPSKVYYQNSNDYPFHYDFAAERLDPFVGMSRPEYDQVSLHPGTSQKAILGAAVLPFNTDFKEYGIQLVGQEPFDRDTALATLEAVRDSLEVPAGTQVFYFPTYEQREAARADAAFFEAAGFPVSGPDRWTAGDVCYSEGWNVGRLTYVAPDDIEDAYTSGTLLPTDILLTDAVPAEVPFVAGIISLTPSTPNSHVAILSESYGIPFVYPRDPAEADRLKALSGKPVSLASGGGRFGCRVQVHDLSTLDAASLQQLVDLKKPAPVDLQPKESLGRIAVDVASLGDDDVRYVGGKAANYKHLLEAIPDNTREAMAFSFDLFDEFMDQRMANGETLRKNIADRLDGLQYPQDIGEISRALSDIRHWIRDDAVVPREQEVLQALGRFDAGRKIRFRSSTNVEDGDTFVGAGLYESYTGCLADDLDGDDSGPSVCDADDDDEDGALRSIRQVYASFYRDNAYLERLRRGVDESQVGMGVLVHYSFPDPTELADGVATYEVGVNTDPQMRIVTQPGEARVRDGGSVTNPDSDAEPEIVEIEDSRWVGTQLRKVQKAALLQLGATTLEWPTEYQEMANLLKRAAQRFTSRRGITEPYKLDFEYKKIEGEGLVIKQVRPVPQGAGDGNVDAFLVSGDVELCTYQGEYSNVFANHQLKSRLKLSGRNTWLSGDLDESLYADGEMQFVRDGEIVTVPGAPSTWSDAQFEAIDGNNPNRRSTTDSWKTTSASNEWTSKLTSDFDRKRMAQQGPLTTPDSFVFYHQATFATPVPAPDWTGGLGTTTEQTVRLVPCPDQRPPRAGETVRTRDFAAGSVSVKTSYVWPPPPRGITAGYTAPLVRWDKTTISGLTSQPIELQGYFSQTYRPGHHNFSAAFLFEPRLEEELDPAIRAELEAKDIVQIYVSQQQDIYTIDSAGNVTQVQ